MVSGEGMVISRRGAVLAAVPFIFLLATLGAHAQQTKTLIVQPPTGWFGVRISDQALVDERGDAFFDSCPVVTGVDSSSPAAQVAERARDALVTFISHDMRGGSP